MKVLASGVFDLLHYGHIRFLEEAKKLGGPDARLVVIVGRGKFRVTLLPRFQQIHHSVGVTPTARCATRRIPEETLDAGSLEIPIHDQHLLAPHREQCPNVG